MKDKEISEILKIVKKIHKGKKTKKKSKKPTKKRVKKATSQPAFRPYTAGQVGQSFNKPMTTPSTIMIPANGFAYNTIPKQLMERNYNNDIMSYNTAKNVNYLKNFVKNLYSTPSQPQFHYRPQRPAINDFTQSVHRQQIKEQSKIESDFGKLRQEQDEGLLEPPQLQSEEEEQVIEPAAEDDEEAEFDFDEDEPEFGDSEEDIEDLQGWNEPLHTPQDVPEKKTRKKQQASEATKQKQNQLVEQGIIDADTEYSPQKIAALHRKHYGKK